MKKFTIVIGNDLCTIEYVWNKKDFGAPIVDRTKSKKISYFYFKDSVLKQLLLDNGIHHNIENIYCANVYRRDGAIYKIPSHVRIQTDEVRTDELSLVDVDELPIALRMANAMLYNLFK
jgi:hypothetical protein